LSDIPRDIQEVSVIITMVMIICRYANEEKYSASIGFTKYEPLLAAGSNEADQTCQVSTMRLGLSQNSCIRGYVP
jgi:hypothetical protein